MSLPCSALASASAQLVWIVHNQCTASATSSAQFINCTQWILHHMNWAVHNVHSVLYFMHCVCCWECARCTLISALPMCTVQCAVCKRGTPEHRYEVQVYKVEELVPSPLRAHCISQKMIVLFFIFSYACFSFFLFYVDFSIFLHVMMVNY